MTLLATSFQVIWSYESILGRMNMKRQLAADLLQLT